MTGGHYGSPRRASRARAGSSPGRCRRTRSWTRSWTRSGGRREVIAKRSPSLSGLRIWVYFTGYTVFHFLSNHTYLTSGRADLAGDDDDDLEAESQDRRSECRRCREHGYIERRVDQEGHEAEERPSHKGAVRARGEEALGVQGMQWVSARSSALSVQGVRREGNM